MPKITYKRKKPVKRVDRQIVREAFANRSLVSALGVVRKFPGEESHVEISDEAGTREVLIDVELMPHGERIQCRLAYGSDGCYRIPRQGQEVAVLLPMDPQSLVKDELDGTAFIVGVLDTNAPEDLDEDTAVLEAPAIHLGAGADQAVIKGDAHNSDLTTFLTALGTYGVALAGLPGMTTPGADFAQALADFLAAMPGHLSTIVKTK